MKKILIVDDELALLRNISKFFGSFRKEFEVFSAPNAEQAYELIKTKSIDILVTDIRLPGMDGLSLLRLALRYDKDLKIIVMTAYSSPDLKQRALRKGALRFMEKPLDLKELLEMVRESLDVENGWSGTMEGLDIFDFTQIMVLCQKSKALKCTHENEEGYLVFYKGRMTHASTIELEGKSAFFEIATWTGGKFNELPLSSISEFNENIHEPATYLMMEAARIRDESNRNISSASDSKKSKTKKSKKNDKEKEMAIDISALKEIDGVLGGCLVDSTSGMILGQLSGSSFNMEIAAAGNTEVVKSKRKTMKALGLNDRIEDILISLGEAYHIIRPLEKKPDLFLYVVLDRAKSNLAMARLEIKALQEKLKH